MANNIDLAGAAGQLWFREFRVADNTGSTDDYAEITGVIGGSINQSHFLKTGAGRLDLSTATSTYEGETIVHGGTLNVNGTLAAVSGAGSHGLVTVMTGATLGGTGTVARPVTAKNLATLSPGASAGELGTGDLALEAGANVKIEFDGAAADKLTVTGAVALDGATLTVAALSAPAAKEYVIIANDGTDAVTGTFAGLAEGGKVTVGSTEYLVTYKGGDGDNDVVLRKRVVGGAVSIR